MKKVLLTASALSLLAGAAVADVKVSGTARAGMNYRENVDLNPNEAGIQEFGIEKRMTINLDASTETDGGVAMGGRIRIRSDEYAGTALSGANVFFSANGFTATVGNINGALEVMPGLYDNSLGLTGLSYGNLAINTVQTGLPGTNFANQGDIFNWDAFSSRGNGAEGIIATYALGGFTFNASYGLASQLAAVSAAYSFGDFTVAAGYQDGDGNVAFEEKLIGIVSGKFGPAGVTFQAADNDGNVKLVLSGNYSFNNFLVEAYVANEDVGDESYGAGFDYDLGGATLSGGIEVLPVSEDVRADLGVRFAF